MRLKQIFFHLFSNLLTLFFMISALFVLLRLTPGGPFDLEKSYSPEFEATLQSQYGLLDPLPIQYVKFIQKLFTGDWGNSFHFLDYTVWEIISGALPLSLILGVASLLFSLLLASFFSYVRYRLRNYSIFFFLEALGPISAYIPNYLLASLLILFFSIYWGLLPAGLLEEKTGWILPIITLSLKPFSLFYTLWNTEIDRVTTAPFVRTARSKGLAEKWIFFRHILRNASIPIASSLGPLTAQLMTGSFVVEAVFQIPGLGKHFIYSVLNRDYPLVLAVTFVYGLFLGISNLFSDLLMQWLDPRMDVS